MLTLDPSEGNTPRTSMFRAVALEAVALEVIALEVIALAAVVVTFSGPITIS